MQPESTTVLDLDQIRGVVGTATFARGLAYFHEGAVQEFDWNTAADTIIGEVDGNRTYVTTVFLTRRTPDVASILRGICTCPVRMNCKHVAALVVAASVSASLPSAIPNWEESLQALVRADPIDQLAHNLGIQFILRSRGTHTQLLVKPVQPGARDLVITSYALLRLDAQSYSENRWSGLILDEAQFAKNHKSKVHQCARNLKASFKLAITGTPMENNLTELWSLLSITAPGLSERRTLHRNLSSPHRK